MLNVLIGFFAGIVSGMGIGGGAILIPMLVFCNQISQQIAQGINLICFIPVAVVALFIHIKNGNVDIKAAIVMAIGGAVGSVIGWLITSLLSAKILQRGFGIFLLCVGINEIAKGVKSNEKT